MDVETELSGFSVLALDHGLDNFPAKPPSQNVEYKHARTILFNVFDQKLAQTQSAPEPRAQRLQPAGNCDVTLPAEAGIKSDVRDWRLKPKETVAAYLPEAQYSEFWTMYNNVKNEDSDIFSSTAALRRAKAEAKRLRNQRGRQEKTNAQPTPIVPYMPGLTSTAVFASLRDQSMTTSDSSHTTNERARGRRQKKMGKRARVQTAEEALTMEAEVFNTIDQNKATAEVASPIGVSPAQAQNICALRQNFAPRQVPNIVPLSVEFASRDDLQGSQGWIVHEDEGFVEGDSGTTPMYHAHVEMQDGILDVHNDDDTV